MNCIHSVGFEENDSKLWANVSGKSTYSPKELTANCLNKCGTQALNCSHRLAMTDLLKLNYYVDELLNESW